MICTICGVFSRLSKSYKTLCVYVMNALACDAPSTQWYASSFATGRTLEI